MNVRFWGQRFTFFTFGCCACAVFFSCGFMDLRPIGLRTVPGDPGSILAEYYSPVILRFDAAMEMRETERIMQITSAGGSTEGDLRWEGNDLYFVPVGGWKPGTRYMLSLSGTAYAADGRELRLAKYIPFYAVSSAPIPLVESFIPADGASAAVQPGGNAILELRFSCPMDRPSTEAALTLDSPGDKHFEWLDDDRTLRVSPAASLSPWTVYRWNLSGKAQSREGVPLAKTFSGQFITDEDRLIPRVLKVFPMRYAGDSWRPLGDNLEIGPASGEGIGVEFNKAMEGESLLRALRFDPSISGRVEQTSPSSLVFIPERDPEPETIYTLRVSGDTRDSGGLKMGADYTDYFTADIPFLKIVSLTVDKVGIINMTGSSQGGAHPVPVDLSGGNALRFSLNFSLPFTPESRIDTALGISLNTFFPDKLAPVSLRFAWWFSDDSTLRMEWEGLEPGAGDEAHYYRLNIPGGRNGINTGTGSYLKETQYVYLEATP